MKAKEKLKRLNALFYSLVAFLAGLSMKNNLYRYVYMAPGRVLMVVGHVILAIWVSTAFPP